MANVDRPMGLVPVQHLDGSPFNGKVRAYLIPSSDTVAVFIGDPVKLAGSAGAAGTEVFGENCEGMPTVAVAAASETLVGVVVGFSPKQSDLTVLHREASTARIAYVADSPDIVFEIQEDSVGGAISADSVGLNADIAYTAGSTTSGISKCELDSSDVTTAAAQLRIVGLSRRADNALGTEAKWLVVINTHAYKSTAGA